VANLKQVWAAIHNLYEDPRLEDITVLKLSELPSGFYRELCKEQSLSPRALVCPGDKRRPATSADGVSNSNVSYFLSTHLVPGQPGRIVAGDRNLSVEPGILVKPSAISDLHWHPPHLHKNGGYILHADGTVQFVSSGELRKEFSDWRNVNNQVVVP